MGFRWVSIISLSTECVYRQNHTLGLQSYFREVQLSLSFLTDRSTYMRSARNDINNMQDMNQQYVLNEFALRAEMKLTLASPYDIILYRVGFSIFHP